MILPKDIKSRNKIRDAKIISLYASGEADQTLIAQRFNLTQARINQILKANARLVLENQDWEKLQRIHIIKSDFKKEEFKNQILSKKDAIELLRKEIEGDEKRDNNTNILVNINAGLKDLRPEELREFISASRSVIVQREPA